MNGIILYNVVIMGKRFLLALLSAPFPINFSIFCLCFETFSLVLPEIIVNLIAIWNRDLIRNIWNKDFKEFKIEKF